VRLGTSPEDIGIGSSKMLFRNQGSIFVFQ